MRVAVVLLPEEPVPPADDLFLPEADLEVEDILLVPVRVLPELPERFVVPPSSSLDDVRAEVDLLPVPDGLDDPDFEDELLPEVRFVDFDVAMFYT